jgi:hypothetical protein
MGGRTEWNRSRINPGYTRRDVWGFSRANADRIGRPVMRRRDAVALRPSPRPDDSQYDAAERQYSEDQQRR